MDPTGIIYSTIAAISLTVLPEITKCGRDSHWLQIEHGSTFIGGFVLTPLAIWAENHLDATRPPLGTEVCPDWSCALGDLTHCPDQGDGLGCCVMLPCPCGGHWLMGYKQGTGAPACAKLPVYLVKMKHPRCTK